MHTEVAKDAILPSQRVGAVGLSGFGVVHGQAAVEQVSLFLNELKEPLFEPFLIAPCDSEYIVLEPRPFPCSVPEFRVEGGNT
jgi:hypothetical protein